MKNNNNDKYNNANLWAKQQSDKPNESKEYTYILMFDDCTGTKDEISSKTAWNFISKIAITGHSFGRGAAGSMFFMSTWDLDKLSTVFASMKMQYILFCVNDHSSSVRMTHDRQSDIFEFFKKIYENVPVG